jgi:hypothetical protein
VAAIDKGESSEEDDLFVKKGGKNQEGDGEEDEVPGEKKIEKLKKKLNLQTDQDVLAQMFGGKDNLDKTDKFLRDYVMNEGWKGGKGGDGEDSDHYQTYKEKNEKGEVVDKEDEERDSEMDRFEAQHNFRFEDKNAAYLTTHARQAAEDSMRRVDDTRKQKRQDAK